ncbi:efflux RND transporter periplasmic adaptor subunit [Methylobacterium isbiliense]|jgi:multidrug efflux system membrane fusion protein|uniref:Multidrug resistance protein MdtA n=1 Tax=Methylobacterium isbiliense TaxID=315478 RepID=A0ABQ4SDW0_9HYPH|nr:efflux RND transporter periplasmic adaptor subunit [Methylobacterium isbiliense]MDN3621617.1 efflux RND transporter periplasmic adaptor subunit [Methylobacterium isbiliense]GJE00739.1 Multidrug resistance protein MdtA [Methylobacterium isbiliense]
MIRLLLLVAAVLAGGAGYLLHRHAGDRQAAWAEVRSALPPRLAEHLPLALAAPAAPKAPAVPPRPVVGTVAAGSTDLPITRTAVGWIEPIATVVVRPRIDGVITEQMARDGQPVQAGDVLYRLDDRELRAQIARNEAALARDQATQTRTQNDVRRVTELLSRSAASQAQFDIATAEAKVASANVAASQATLEADRVRLDYTTIRAPISGRLGTVRVTTGNLVKGNESTGTGLVTITQMKPLRATFSLPERELDLLRAALARKEPATVRVSASGTDTVLASGRLSFVDSSVDQASGTVTAWALFPNEDERLWPGQYVRVEVDLGRRPNTVTVPQVAVQPGQDGSFVWVVRPDGIAERRSVEVLSASAGSAALTRGIAAGERVVVEGQVRVRHGQPVTERPQSSAPEAQAAGPQVRRTLIE